MISVGESLMQYALGKKGHTHIKRNKKKRFPRENKNVTKIQNFLDKYYQEVKGIV